MKFLLNKYKNTKHFNIQGIKYFVKSSRHQMKKLKVKIINYNEFYLFI